jgi:hypothetical protein
MARHNREGTGVDQRGYEYRVNYQPDWLRLVKVTRSLESGRQSTKTLFRNPTRKSVGQPGETVRTRIISREQGLDFEVSITDRFSSVNKLKVAYSVEGEDGGMEEIEFMLEHQRGRRR